MLRLLALFVVLLLASACGGGSGGGGGGSTGNTQPDPLTEEEQAARAIEILEGCSLEQLTTLTQVSQILQEAAAGVSSGPVLALGGTPTLVPGLSIPYTLDLDADETVDATGVIAFFDEQGQPTQPFNVIDLAGVLTGGLSGLADLLATLPDDTFIRVTYAGTNLLVANGELTVRYVGGVPTGVEGTFTVPGATCTTTFAWDEVPVADFEGEYVNATFDVTIVSGSDVLAGTVTADGEGGATATLQLNDGAFLDYAIDFETGAVTRV